MEIFLENSRKNFANFLKNYTKFWSQKFQEILKRCLFMDILEKSFESFVKKFQETWNNYQEIFRKNLVISVNSRIFHR